MCRREAHVGEDIALSLIHQLGELLDPGAQLVGDLPPLGPGGLASSWAKAVAMKAETTRRLCLPAWASALRMKWTRQRCHEEFRTLAMAAFSPSWASETTSLWPRRPRLASLRRKSVQKHRVGHRRVPWRWS